MKPGFQWGILMSRNWALRLDRHIGRRMDPKQFAVSEAALAAAFGREE